MSLMIGGTAEYVNGNYGTSSLFCVRYIYVFVFSKEIVTVYYKMLKRKVSIFVHLANSYINNLVMCNKN